MTPTPAPATQDCLKVLPPVFFHGLLSTTLLFARKTKQQTKKQTTSKHHSCKLILGCCHQGLKASPLVKKKEKKKA